MRILIKLGLIAMGVLACSDSVSLGELKGSSDIIREKMTKTNSSQFDFNLSLKLPDRPLDVEQTKESCDQEGGTFVALDIIGDKKTKLCLSSDSLKSAASFVRYGADFLSIAWAGFVGESGEKKFSAIIELGSFCSQSAVGACIDVYLGEGSYDKSKMQKALSSRPKVLEDGTVEILIREYLDNPVLEKIIKDNVNGVRLTASFKNVIAGMAVNIISMNIPDKVVLNVGDFKRQEGDFYSVKADIEIPKQWLGKSRGDFKIPFASQLISFVKQAAPVAPMANKLRIMVNHDCNAMLLSPSGDKNVCVPVEKSALEFVIESPAITKIIGGETLSPSFERAEHSYRSMQVKLEGLGIGLAKTEKASCSHNDPKSHDCSLKYSLQALKYDEVEGFLAISLSQGLKTVAGHNEAGFCKGRFALRSSFNKIFREKIAISQLYPLKLGSPLPRSVIDNMFRNISCYDEIPGSCECSTNGKPWICQGDSCR